jgi:hypothetical protein
MDVTLQAEGPTAGVGPLPGWISPATFCSGDGTGKRLLVSQLQPDGLMVLPPVLNQGNLRSADAGPALTTRIPRLGRNGKRCGLLHTVRGIFGGGEVVQPRGAAWGRRQVCYEVRVVCGAGKAVWQAPAFWGTCFRQIAERPFLRKTRRRDWVMSERLQATCVAGGLSGRVSITFAGTGGRAASGTRRASCLGVCRSPLRALADEPPVAPGVPTCCGATPRPRSGALGSLLA